MPRSRSSKKNLRQTRSRTATNRAQRSRLRTVVKSARTAETAEARLSAAKSAEKLLDRAGRKRLIHPNTAARIKSRLVKAAARDT